MPTSTSTCPDDPPLGNRRARAATTRFLRHGRVAGCLAVLAVAACHGSQADYRPSPVPADPPDGHSSTIYLVGDAGEESPGRTLVLEHLRADIERTSARSPSMPIVVLFLGDNIYDVGAREDYRDEDLAHLVAQVGALGDAPSARGIFLPGNHDWAKGAAYTRGVGALGIQQEWLGEMGDRASLIPSDGCPGPTPFDVDDWTRLLLIDTEWLLRRPSDECGSFDDFFRRLDDELRAAGDRRVILAAHHPLATGGPHGGNVGLFEYGPLVYYLAVKAGLGVQDLASGRYRDLLAGFARVLSDQDRQPFLFAAGHDHSLQVIGTPGPGTPTFQLVSGSGSKRSPADRIEGTRYALGDHGYMRLELGPNDAVVTVFGVDDGLDAIGQVFACALQRDGVTAECPEAPRGDGP